MRYKLIQLGILLATAFSTITQIDEYALAQSASTQHGIERTPYLTFAELRENFLEAKPGIKKGQAARELFKEATPDTVRRLRFDTDDGIALSAAWYRLELQMFAKLVSADSSAEIVSVPQALTREFLAFVEGRLNVPAPDGWMSVVRGVHFHQHGLQQYPVLTRAMKLYEGEIGSRADLPDESGRLTLPQLHLTTDDGTPKLFYVGGSPGKGQDARAIVPDKLRGIFDERKVADRPWLISGIAATNRAIVALRGEHGPGGDIYCITTVHQGQKPAVIWSASMDANWSSLFKGSEWFTELRMDDEKVFLFHGTHNSIGIECFLLADGKRQFSFNSRLPEPF